ncbi:hypothetical protein FSARC_2544 [Fusarium sarcochroum]|uniref:WSC domain-containing protein n=1 Tax=Fusarium sarcochroum TaxID=1208366 RepID=A0A8H4U6E7_9HYPO|nr:hypothetical protein FSARC_2544 [Fusarium sarcochroum]
MKLLATLILSALVGRVCGLASTDTITWGGDNSRTGYQTNHNMDPAIVGSPQFDIVFKTSLPGRYIGATEQIFSQPLVYTPSGGTKQYVYLATTQNNIYKLDAKTGEILASRNIGIPFLTADLDGCVDVNPTVGVTATGVIDPSTDTWYITSKTYANQNGGQVPQGRPAGRYKIHAINVNDLTEQPNFPVDLENTISRNNPERMFTGGIHHQRPGLLHTGQYVYAGFASHCVQYNFTGWIMGWDKTTGKIVESWASEGLGVNANISGAGIWQSGGGLASDNAGSMYFATGNGYASQLSTIPVNGFTPPTAMEQAAVHMSINDNGTLSIVDFFMPYEKQELDGADKDLGTSPLELLPSQFSCGDVKRMGIVTGKSGKTYWLNLDDLGGYRNGPNSKDRVIQTFQNENSVYAGAGVYPLEGGYIYINVIQYPTHVFKFSCLNGVPYFTKVADSPTNNAYILGVSHGTTTSLNGQEGTGMLWVSDVQNTNFKVYDAIPKNGYLNVIRNFTIVGITKFSRPVFGDGMAYIGTTVGYFYGLGSTNKTPLNCTSPVDFGTADFQDITNPQAINCTALFDLSVTSIALADSTNYNITQAPTLPLTMSAGDNLQFSAQFFPKSVGRLGGTINIQTSGVSDASYSKSIKVRVTGVGKSTNAVLDVSPNSIAFSGLVSGSQADSQSILIGNDGTNSLQVSAVLYSNTSSTGPFSTWSGIGALTVGKFVLSNIPASVSGGGDSAISVKPDTSVSGNYTAWVKFVTTGGNATVSLSATAGDPPTALLEFQTPDGSSWVKYDPNNPFTFGNVTENTSKSLRFRVSNTAAAGGVKLGFTVSKPPFGVSGIVKAANQIDLAEGTLIAPGQSQSATLTCTVPKSQWNIPSYNGTAQWTMNTNDPTWSFEKKVIQFFCNAVSEQAAPLLPSGQGQYQYVGCFKENNPGRQLSSLLYSNSSNTNEMCINACGVSGMTFCGTQYRGECWTGNKIPNQKVDDKNCNFDCAGSLNQICGGNGIDGSGVYISLFADTLQWDGTFASVTTSSAGSTATPQGPSVNPGVNGYTSIGCYTEATSGRALPNGRGVDSPTVANCVQACSNDNFVYAGVEYGGECYCGNSFSDGSVPAPLADCGMTCNGNSSEYCGGGNRLNVYQLNAAYSSSLPTSLSTSSASSSGVSSASTSSGASLLVLSSASTASTSSVSTASGASASGSSTSGSASTTSSTSAGVSSNTLGGTSSSSTSVLGNVAGSANSGSTSTSGSTSKASVSSSSATGSSATSVSLSGSSSSTGSTSYFIDFDVDNLFNSFVRVLSLYNYFHNFHHFEHNLVERSFFKHGIIGYNFFCHEPFYICWPSIFLHYVFLHYVFLHYVFLHYVFRHYVSSYFYHFIYGVFIDDIFHYLLFDCSLANHNFSRKLYEHHYLNYQLYNLYSTTSSKPVATGPSISDTVGTWNFQGCWTEGFLIRALNSKAYASDDMTLESCAAYCSNFNYFGTENGRECYCGNQLNFGSYQAPNQKDCSATCAGDNTDYCGGTLRLQLYKVGGKSVTPAVDGGNRNFTSYSCVQEPLLGRLLPNLVASDAGSMTVDTCLEKCWMYKYAGIENGRDCFCGNTVNWQGLIPNLGPGKNVSMSDCNLSCPGDKLSWCGGLLKMNLYVNNSTALAFLKKHRRRHAKGLF